MKKTKSGSCTIATADIGDGEVFCRGAAAGRVGRGGEAVAPEAQVVPRYRAMSLAWLAQPRLSHVAWLAQPAGHFAWHRRSR